MKYRDPAVVKASEMSEELAYISDMNLVYFFMDEILRFHQEGGRTSNYFNNTITRKLWAFKILEKAETSWHGSKTKVSEKGLNLVRKFSKLDYIINKQAVM